MLTPQDLSAIEKMLDTKLEAKFEEKLKPISKSILTIQKDIRKLKQDSAYVVDILDREDMSLRNRVDRIEHHLGFN